MYPTQLTLQRPEQTPLSQTPVQLRSPCMCPQNRQYRRNAHTTRDADDVRVRVEVVQATVTGFDEDG